MKIAVTAANGKLGSNIIKELLKTHASADIIGLARTPAKAQFLIDDYGIEIRGGDYDNAEQLTQSLQGVDKILLVSGLEDPTKRIGQHRNVINAAKHNDVKKIVYTSIQGAEKNTAFSPVVQSNRQTETDIRDSGLDFVIGRNGIYIEPDIDYIDHYKKEGAIHNSAGDGKCGYTTYGELAYAYAQLLADDKHNGKTYNLHGEAITQYQLADYLNLAFGTSLTYEPMTIEAFHERSIAELGEHIGSIVSGIYEGISKGKCDNPSDYSIAADRPHQSWNDYFNQLKSVV